MGQISRGIDILTDPNLASVYQQILTLAEEFAILGHVATAATLISVLLRNHGTEHQRWVTRHLKFAFAEAKCWPAEIPPSERTEEALREQERSMENWPYLFPEEYQTPDENGLMALIEMYCNDENRQDGATGSRAMYTSMALAKALAIAVMLNYEDQNIETNPGKGERRLTKANLANLENDHRVQTILRVITSRLRSNGQIQYLMEQRIVWSLLASGAISRLAGANNAEVATRGEASVATVNDRFRYGRLKVELEGKSLVEILQIIEYNTNMHGRQYQEQQSASNAPMMLFREPASALEIAAFEDRSGVALPSDYKEFLSITNGFGAMFDGVGEVPPLHPISIFSEDPENTVHWEEVEPFGLELYNQPSGTNDIPKAMGKEWDEWPMFNRVLEIGSEDILSIWLLPPEDVQRAVKAYKEALAHEKVPEALKQEIRDCISSLYGSMEEFDNLGWCVFEDVCGESMAGGTFRTWLANKARESC